MYPADDSVRKDIALAFASDMAKVGVVVKLEGLTFDVIEKRQDRGATEFGYGTPYDPDIELYSLFHSKFATADDDAFTNYPAPATRAIDAALDARALDARRRGAQAGVRPLAAGARDRTRAGCGSCGCATSSRSPSASAASTRRSSRTRMASRAGRRGTWRTGRWGRRDEATRRTDRAPAGAAAVDPARGGRDDVRARRGLTVRPDRRLRRRRDAAQPGAASAEIDAAWGFD